MKIGWILVGDRNVGSARILGYNLHNWISANTEVKSEILVANTNFQGGANLVLEMSADRINSIANSGFDWIIFQKVCSGSADMLAKKCREKGVKTAFIIDDLEPVMLPMIQLVDIAIMGDDSTLIGEWVYQQIHHPRIFTLSDAYETPKDFYKKDYSQHGTLKVVWFGNMSHCVQAAFIKPVTYQLGYQYTIIANSLEADKIWSLDTIYDDIVNSDVVVIPYPSPLPPYEVVKGPCRVIQAMALGMPIITSPYPSYVTMIRNGWNGIVVFDNTVNGWRGPLEAVAKEEYRQHLGTHARETVVEKYNVAKVATDFIKTLEEQHDLTV